MGLTCLLKVKTTLKRSRYLGQIFAPQVGGGNTLNPLHTSGAARCRSYNSGVRASCACGRYQVISPIPALPWIVSSEKPLIATAKSFANRDLDVQGFPTSIKAREPAKVNTHCSTIVCSPINFLDIHPGRNACWGISFRIRSTT